MYNEGHLLADGGRLMTVYTSTYWKYKGDRGVQISNSKPEDVKVYKRLPTLFPRWYMVDEWNKVKQRPTGDRNRQETWQRFEQDYWAKLCEMGSDKVISLLEDGDVLLCWCSRNCHRHILARFLREHGVEVKEVS